MAVEAYKQLAVLEPGFVQYALPSLAVADLLNMVLGALYKNRIYREARNAALAEGRAEGYAEALAEGRAQGHAEAKVNRDKVWREWLRRKAAAEANGQAFTEPAPDEAPQR